jgi:hypothetical protein
MAGFFIRKADIDLRLRQQNIKFSKIDRPSP